ncbi:hypothetical protein [Kitasatospora aureofaciens]|uniref:hypothetical protein n=1 Tax=Kitasatospora aureofaciens TaxID=1894 RepID=UPI001C479E54|nr:hypothetical protein [Kitasatospora aureofaciens]MBV6699494.1 hypothetical protein [Kitasatospora aureofaciens]
MATNEQGRSAARIAERLIGLEGPKEVFLAAGEWMGYRLESDGFRWLNGRTSLERRLDGRLERMRLEASRWNRAGSLIEFSIVGLEVFDEELQAWRGSNADRTVERPGSMAGIVCATSFLDISREPKAIITLPAGRLVAVDRLYEHAKEVALPWFRSSEIPEGLASAVPDALLRPTGFAQDLLELLVSRGLAEEARALIRRVLELGEPHRESFSEGRNLANKGERPLWHSPQALGWSSEILGLI